MVKYDSLGNVLWARNYDTSYINASSLTIDTSGNIYMTGSFHCNQLIFGSDTLTDNVASNETSMFLVKYDSTGNVIWARKSFSSNSSFVQGNSVSADAAGNIYMAGIFQSSLLIFADDTLKNVHATDYDMFIVKYDVVGNAIWARQSIGGVPLDAVTNLATEASGNVYVVGDFYSPVLIFGNDTFTNLNVSSYLVKYDIMGNMLWAKNYTGIHGVGIRSIAVDVVGNIDIAGGYSDTLILGGYTLTGSAPYTGMFFIAKCDSYGHVLWAKSSEGTTSSSIVSLKTDDSCNIYTVGHFYMSSPPSNTLIIGNDTLYYAGVNSAENIFLAEYSTAGDVIFATSIGQDCGVDVSGITLDQSGRNVYITGNYDCPLLLFGSLYIGRIDSLDEPYLAKYSIEPAYTPIEKLVKPFITVFPNPAYTELTITSSSAITTLQIINMIGQDVTTFCYRKSSSINSLGYEDILVDISKLLPGIYFIKINGSELRKYVKG